MWLVTETSNKTDSHIIVLKWFSNIGIYVAVDDIGRDARHGIAAVAAATGLVL